MMIVNINNNQYNLSENGLLSLENIIISNNNIIIAKVLAFRCGNDLIFNNSNNAKWLIIGNVIGSIASFKYLCRKFKRRKGYKRTKNYRNIKTLVHFFKLIKIANTTTLL